MGFDNAPIQPSLSKLGCIERVRRGRGYFFKAEMLSCRNTAKWRVDGLGPLGALYSDVPMCSQHRAKYDRAGYRSWPIQQPNDQSHRAHIAEPTNKGDATP